MDAVWRWALCDYDVESALNQRAQLKEEEQ